MPSIYVVMRRLRVAASFSDSDPGSPVVVNLLTTRVAISAVLFPHLSSCSDGIRQLFKHLDSRLPVDACIRDAHPLFETSQTALALSGGLLIARFDIALDHDCDDCILAGSQLIA